MPYTTHQINRLIGDGDSRVIPKAAPLTLSQRVSESEVRRRVYSYEDKAALDTLNLFRQAWADIRNASTSLADSLGITGKLNPGLPASTSWKRQLALYTDERWRKLLSDSANLTAGRIETAWHAGYLGRAWSAVVSTKADVDVRYSIKPRDVIWNTFGSHWIKRTGETFYDSYMLIAGKYSQKSRQSLNTALINGETVPQANRRLKDLLGIATLKEAFWFTQSNTRTAILSASQLGAIRLYAENARVQEATGAAIGAIFLTAGDGRVCNRCRQYAGRIFRVDSLLGATVASMIEPPIHENCRCSFAMIIAPDWLLPDDVPPGMTWQEWLLLTGLDALLADFMDMGLESTQVGDEASYADI